MKRRVIGLLSSLVALSVALPACSGGSASSVVPERVEPKAMIQASFTIHWPQKTASARRPSYISASAASVIVEVNPNASTRGPVTFANNNGTPTSTVNFDAPAGTDDIVFTVYDAKQKTGETQAQGNLLGQVELPAQNIVAGRQNAITATVGGITSRIDVAPVANQPFVERDANGGYDIVGDTAQTFIATPYDADGNVIVGPGSPTLSFSSPSAGTSLDIQPVANTPSSFSVRALAGQPSTAALGIVLKATDTGVPHFCTANVSLRVRSALYVSYTHGSGSKVLVYDDHGNLISLPSTAFSGINSPGGLAYAGKEHRLYVADGGANKLLAFDAQGNAVSGFSSPGVAGVKNVAYDPVSDKLYATTATSVKAFNPDGTGASLIASPFASTAAPNAIAYVGVDGLGNPDDEIAVGNDSNSGGVSIDYYHPDGTFLRSFVPYVSEAIAPVSALAWGSGTFYHQLAMLGGPIGSSYGIAVTYDESIFGSAQVWPASRVGGATMVSTVPNSSPSLGFSNYELYITQSDTNTIAGFIYSQNDSTEFNYPDVTFVTPSATGVSNPVGITSAL